MKTLLFLATAAALLLAATSVAAADKPAAKNSCFSTTQWDGWSAPGDGDALYLKVGMRDVYRVELAPGSHVRKDPDKFLINKVRGSSWICSAIDLDLTLADHEGFKEPVFAKSLRKLTPDEVAAIPKADRP